MKKISKRAWMTLALAAALLAGLLVFFREYLGITKEDDLAQAIIEAGAKSKAALFVAQMQDYLGLGGEARMNEPGTLKVENWRWRMLPGQADAQLAQKILCLTQQAKRV